MCVNGLTCDVEEVLLFEDLVPPGGRGHRREHRFVVDALEHDVAFVGHGVESCGGNGVHDADVIVVGQLALVVVLDYVVDYDARVVAFAVAEVRDPRHHRRLDLLALPERAVKRVLVVVLPHRVDILPGGGHVQHEFRLQTHIRRVVGDGDAFDLLFGNDESVGVVLEHLLSVRVVELDLHFVLQVLQVGLEQAVVQVDAHFEEDVVGLPVEHAHLQHGAFVGHGVVLRVEVVRQLHLLVVPVPDHYREVFVVLEPIRQVSEVKDHFSGLQWLQSVDLERLFEG